MKIRQTPGNADNPPPQASTSPAMWDLVRADIEERDRVGQQRYGTRLQANNGRDALVDAYQEALDLVVYLRQVIYERDIKPDNHVYADGLHPSDAGYTVALPRHEELREERDRLRRERDLFGQMAEELRESLKQCGARNLALRGVKGAGPNAVLPHVMEVRPRCAVGGCAEEATQPRDLHLLPRFCIAHYGRLTIAQDSREAQGLTEALRQSIAAAEAATTEVERLRAAIRDHRDAEVHDRCWLDDDRLYEVLGEDPGNGKRSLPPRGEFLARCSVFHERRSAGGEYVTPPDPEIQQRIADLEKERAVACEERDAALKEAQSLRVVGENVVREREDLRAVIQRVKDVFRDPRLG